MENKDNNFDLNKASDVEKYLFKLNLRIFKKPFLALKIA